MNKKKVLLGAALASLVAAGSLSQTAPAFADDADHHNAPAAEPKKAAKSKKGAKADKGGKKHTAGEQHDEKDANQCGGPNGCNH